MPTDADLAHRVIRVTKDHVLEFCRRLDVFEVEEHARGTGHTLLAVGDFAIERESDAHGFPHHGPFDPE
jgi:hypothetical protein